MSGTNSSKSSILMMEVDQSENAFHLPSWSKGAYLTCSEEEMITATLPVYDPARFARTGSPLLVLADFPMSRDQEQTPEDIMPLLQTRRVTDNRTRRTAVMLMTFLGLAMLVVGVLSYIHV